MKNNQPKKDKAVKAWCVIDGREIIKDSWWVEGGRGEDRKPLYAIFSYEKIDSYSPLWGYAIGKQKIVPCKIYIKNQDFKT